MNPPFIIAEIGVNHDGNVSKAKKLILEAKACGASAVKFQSFSAENLASINTPKVEYQKKRDSFTSHFEMLKSLELSYEEQENLQKFSLQNAIEFMSTPYSCDQAEFLESLGVEKFKTASADIVDIPLHKKIASFKKLTFISTGMSSIEEIDLVSKIYIQESCPFVLMHATSEYPCPIEFANLRKLENLRNLGSIGLGFSDHTRGSVAAVVAVGMGCSVFEKHFTLHCDDLGPDHSASADPQEFRSYVNEINFAWKSLGSDKAQMSSAESEMSQVSRKSVCYSKDFEKGDTVTLEDLKLIRPGTGVSWWTAEQMLPATLTTSVRANEQLKPSDFNFLASKKL